MKKLELRDGIKMIMLQNKISFLLLSSLVIIFSSFIFLSFSLILDYSIEGLYFMAYFLLVVLMSLKVLRRVNKPSKELTKLMDKYSNKFKIGG